MATGSQAPGTQAWNNRSPAPYHPFPQPGSLVNRSLTKREPVIVAGPVTITPPAAALVLTTFAPQLRRVITPGNASLVLSTFAPQLRTVVTPAKASLVLTGFVPQLRRVITPGSRALVLSTFAPTVTTPRVITPAKASLLLTTFAPTVTSGSTLPVPQSGGIFPGRQELNQPWPYKPLRVIEKPEKVRPTPVVISPATAHLRLRGHIPVIWTTRTLTTYAPKVEVTRNITATELSELYGMNVITAEELIAFAMESIKQ